MQVGANERSRIYHFASHESADGNHSVATQKPPQPCHPMSPHPICRESKLCALPCLNLIGGQGVPGPQMPKGICPNRPLCCHASVHHHCERGLLTYLELRGIQTVVCTRICSRGEGGGGGSKCRGQIWWSRLQSRAVHCRWWCKGLEGTVDSQQSRAPMHNRRQASVPRSRAEWTPMSRMDARHSVSGLPDAQRQQADLLPLELYSRAPICRFDGWD